MIHKMQRVIPAEPILARLTKNRAKQQQHLDAVEELRREEKILSDLLKDAVDTMLPVKLPDVVEPGIQPVPPEPETPRDPHPGTTPRSRLRGLVDAITDALGDEPGIEREVLVDRLLPLVPEGISRPDARRKVLNNLGNLIRNGRVRTENNRLFLTGEDRNVNA